MHAHLFLALLLGLSLNAQGNCSKDLADSIGPNKSPTKEDLLKRVEDKEELHFSAASFAQAGQAKRRLPDPSSASTALEFEEFISELAQKRVSDRKAKELIGNTPFIKSLNQSQSSLDLSELFSLEDKSSEYLKRRESFIEIAQGFLGPKVLRNIDQRLHASLLDWKVGPLEAPKQDSNELVHLGEQLFHDPILSGNKNTSCSSCHVSGMGTSDNLPLSLGQGAHETSQGRRQGEGAILRRNAPTLFNLGQKDADSMFWDGRVHLDLKTGQLSTPEKALNGLDPENKEISEALSDALATQALFPIASRDEMRGHFGNELAEVDGNIEVWERVMSRLIDDPKQDYLDLFRQAYPGVRKRDLNIGHAGTALSAFMRREFDVRDTPFDAYVKGDLKALTDQEKKGLEVFLGKGKCILCHGGADLAGGHIFTGIATPHIYPQGEFKDDLGRFEITGIQHQRYKFRAPGLRNIALSGPYMHNGAFSTLEEVIEHYDDVAKGLADFKVTEKIQGPYDTPILVDKDIERNAQRLHSAPPFLRQGLNFTEEDEAALLAFLERALTSYRFLSQVP